MKSFTGTLLIGIILGFLVKTYVPLSYFKTEPDTYSKADIDKYTNITQAKIQELQSEVFPKTYGKAYKLSEEKKCQIDMKTMDCTK